MLWADVFSCSILSKMAKKPPNTEGGLIFKLQTFSLTISKVLKHMTLVEQMKLVRRMDDNIGRKKTGTAQEFASFLGISRTQFFYYLDVLRAFEAEIAYCKFRRTYYYVDNRKPRF